MGKVLHKIFVTVPGDAIRRLLARTLRKTFVIREAETLYRDGIVVIENYLSPERCDAIKGQIDVLVDDFRKNVNHGGVKGTKDGQDIFKSTETVIDVRDSFDGTQRYDVGMVDIFNIDATVSELSEIRNDKRVRDIITEAAGADCISQNMNCYLSQSVTNTRVHHVDSFGSSDVLQFKAFVYLTDVSDEGCGPYSYVKRSHLAVCSPYVNLAANLINGRPLTDMRIHNKRNLVKLLAPKGTLIISNQYGFHGGLPQSAGSERVMLVNNFYGAKGGKS
jgi:hypothetical protein